MNEVERFRKRREKRLMKRTDEFKESDHPRGENGQFTSGNGGIKKKQLEVILKENPAKDDYHTWIRSEDDIKSFDEVVDEMEDIAPDVPKKVVDEAKRTGKIKVYSSHDIKGGTFVTPSKMIARDYSGGGSIKEMYVPVGHVAWIDGEQGQYVGDVSGGKRKEDK